MKRTTRRNSILTCGLLAVMVAGLAQGATTFRYVGSGDYNDLLSVTGVNGWPAGGTGAGGLPGLGELIRFNYGNNVVTLTNPAPNVAQLQTGVDESGTLVVESGGQLTVAGGTSRIGNNGGAGVVGQLFVKTNGQINFAAVVHVGNQGGTTITPGTGILTIDGGTLNLSNHLWVGSAPGSSGTVIITNGGVLNIPVVGNLGIGSGDAVNASGGTGVIRVSDGSALNLFNIDALGRSIQGAGSVLDIQGSGVVTIPGDRIAVMSIYTNNAKITAYGGTGTVGIDTNTIPGKTRLTAIGGYVPPTDVVWDPTQNPSTSGLWSENANWTGGLRPASVTKVTFNVPGAIPCVLNGPGAASHIVMGQDGPGGTLIVTNGGSLACGTENASVLGSNSNALMVVENGGSALFGTNLMIGFDSGSEGTLIMNGGTVSVARWFYLGSQQGGKGTAQIKGGTLNLSLWDYYYAIQGASVLDISGTGTVVINGNQVDSVNGFIITGQITNSVGTNLVVDYNIIHVGKTTIYPVGLDLGPEEVTWHPELNLDDTNGLWNVSANWQPAMRPANMTVVTFNVDGAIPCVVTNAAVAGWFQMGNSGGPGGTLILTNGGSLTTLATHWSGVGYSSNALMIVENGSSASFAEHLWIGLVPGSDGTFIMNGGTVSVAGMFGLGFEGGKGTAQINGGTLDLDRLDPINSIKGASVLNLTGTGTVVIRGNYVSTISNFVSSGKITANGGPNVAFSFDSGANKTTIQVAPPRQSVSTVAVSGGNATLTYQTTVGHIYHVESTPSLSPTSWTRVAGSTTNATGASVTFSFPVSGDQVFYRTVSP